MIKTGTASGNDKPGRVSADQSCPWLIMFMVERTEPMVGVSGQPRGDDGPVRAVGLVGR